ncbi:hypothetical protein [Saccharothrix violaceirubra]|uniref:Ni,Fe-hydrogenase maturation factor n=1 Tax=Saccharothrix violaceirubra TaxID=413306 RepID=A0A7W7T5Y3_9PSEU|nr:hypothetical protein [Saccharothrix violaceirubra]MBB4966941.1 Ni,Fe-hydrogenase maturation factor [Saccharothrix violaceirubra]
MIFAVEVADTDVGRGLSQMVRMAVPRVVQAVLDELHDVDTAPSSGRRQ